jgi:hypothetical protein
MYEWKEFDPYTGVTTINYASDDDDLVHVERIQDVQPTLDLNAELRNTGAEGKEVKKYASVPVTVQYELLRKGINIFNPDHMPRVLQEINQNYPKLKATNKHHELGSRKPSNSQPQENSTQPGPFVIVR